MYTGKEVTKGQIKEATVCRGHDLGQIILRAKAEAVEKLFTGGICGGFQPYPKNCCLNSTIGSLIITF